MREARMYSFSACFSQRTRDVRQRTTRVAHVVNNQTIASTHIADDIHHLSHVCLFTTLIAKGEFCVESLGISPCALSTAGVGSNHSQVGHRMLLIVTVN